MKKSLIGILMTTVILMALAVPLATIPAVSAADSADWYKTVSGNLSTDAYLLYPFSTYNNLKIGFSQFGEMINSNDNVGLEYGTVDPFAPASGSAVGSIVKSTWLNGWICNITYYHTILAQVRTVWASAQHSDATMYGGNWIRVDFPNDRSITYGEEDPRDPGYIIGNYAAGDLNYGGRKTNGTAITSPIQVLYDGPRSFVALLTTTIYDHTLHGSDTLAEDIPLLEVRFMIVFEKCKKEVVVFKELKTLVPDKYTDVLKVQFSNRGEVDLGDEDSQYQSYFHFYTQGVSRGLNWQGTGKNYENNDTLAQGLSTPYDRNWVLNVTENPITSPWYNYSAAGPYPQTSSATYDLAIAYNPDAGYFGYTWWAAFWPSLSDWSIDGWPMWWRSMEATDAHDIDSRTWATYPRTEPTIPFYIGEWDVELKPKGKMTPAGGFDQQQYRFVTVYGVSDTQDGSDANQAPYELFPGYWVTPTNRIDSETEYQLKEVFNPWDLAQAVHKVQRSWVEWTTGSTYYVTLRKPVLVVPSANWHDYNIGSERVIDYNATGMFAMPVLSRGGIFGDGYQITQLADGRANITGLNATRTYKILYTTLPDVSGTASATSTYTSTIYNSTTSVANRTTVTQRVASSTWDDNIDVTHSFSVTVPAINVGMTDNATAALNGTTASNWTERWTVQKSYDEDNFKVFLGETYVATLTDIYDPINVTLGNTTFTFDFGAITKSLKSPDASSVIWPNDKSETVHVDYLNHVINFTITIANTNYTDAGGVMLNQTYVVAAALTVTASYRNYLMGRYEWAVVGRDAASVDSAGAALVTAAFKNKQVEIWMAGADMYNTLVANQMPWVMAKMTSGDAWVNYLKTGAGTDPGNYRAYLRDDWCKQGTSANDEIPVATSNMIGVGGPLANLLAYYGNDFTSAFFGLADFTDYAAWEGKLVPKVCWDHAKGYTDTNTVGYATISTYRDINETVLFLVWGNWGRDTFYATKWFHEHGVYQLQEVPRGVTDIILQINYQSTSEGYKPTSYSIVEVLGTISERTWIHGTTTKGGIHDP
jgi:hypothetical protein